MEYNSDDLGRERICNLVELEPWRHIRLKPGGAEILELFHSRFVLCGLVEDAVVRIWKSGDRMCMLGL